MKQQISTIADLVSAFGGTSKLAKFLDVVPPAVSNWKDAGAIPRGHHLRIYLEAQARGFDIAPNVFGLKEWPPTSPPKRRAAYQPAA